MALSWIKRAKRPASVDDLVARRKYGKAIELMRKDFSQRYPTATERLRFADVLVLDDRGPEAVPVLLGIADEQERYGFPDKAIEALRRAAEIDPEQAEVKDRLESIRTAPTEAPAEESPAGDDASSDWGSALDGAFAESTAPEESEPDAEEVVTGVEAEMLAVETGAEPEAIGVSAGVPEPVAGFEGELESTPPDQLEAAPPVGEPEPLPQIDEIQLDEEPDEEELLLSEDDLEPEELEAVSDESDPPVAGADTPRSEELATEGPVSSEEGVPASVPEAEENLRPFLTADELEAELESDAKALLSGGNPGPAESRPFLTADELEAELEGDANALLSGGPPDLDEPRALLTEEDLDAALATDARALIPGGDPEEEEFRPLLTEEELDEAIAEDARALLSEGPMSEEPGPVDAEHAAEARALLSEVGPREEELRPLLTEDDLQTDAARLLSDAGLETGSAPRLPVDELEPLSDEDEEELHAFVLALGKARGSGRSALGAVFFAGLAREELRRVSEGLHPRTYAPGDMVIREGEPGDTVFLIASGSVRILVMGGHGQPFEIRRIDAGDFFGEVAALSGKPRTATVVAATPCEMLEIERSSLDTLVALRPAARALLDEACVGRALSPEETAVRSLPAEAADPRRAAAALRAHFGGCEWSPRVRLHLAGLMLDVGREEDALAILAGVAEDLARRGHAQKAVAVLKKVERIQQRGMEEVSLAPLGKGKRASSRRKSAKSRAADPPASRAVREAAFREWVGSLLRETAALAARATPSVEEVAEGAGEEQGDELAGQSSEPGVHRLRGKAGGNQSGDQHAG